MTDVKSNDSRFGGAPRRSEGVLRAGDLPPQKALELSWSFPRYLSWLGMEWKAMKASKFTDDQKAFIIKQGEGGTPPRARCEAGHDKTNLIKRI
jgi:hypothetical protein